MIHQGAHSIKAHGADQHDEQDHFPPPEHIRDHAGKLHDQIPVSSVLVHVLTPLLHHDAQLGDAIFSAGALNAIDEFICTFFIGVIIILNSDLIDEIVIFHKLSDENIRSIARLMLGEITSRIESMKMKITFTDEVVGFLAKEGFDPVYGARPLRRAMQRKIEDSLSIELLEGKLGAGDVIEAYLDGDVVKYRKTGTFDPEGREPAAVGASENA